MGDALAHQGRYAEAATALQAALDTYPMATPPTPLNLAYTHRVQLMLTDAQSHLKPGAKPR